MMGLGEDNVRWITEHSTVRSILLTLAGEHQRRTEHEWGPILFAKPEKAAGKSLPNWSRVTEIQLFKV